MSTSGSGSKVNKVDPTSAATAERGSQHSTNMSLKPPSSAVQLESKGSHSMARNGSCYLVRHTPHPRRVCPVRGVSPAPNSVKVHPPRPHSEPCRKIRECFTTSSENPLGIKKEIKVKNPPSPPKACYTAACCSSEVMSTKTNVQEKTVCIPNYLDQEIKILAKLCNILRTDSLAEVLQWLLHASSKEKEWVSALIHAELAEINLLAGPQRRSISAEPAAVTAKPTQDRSPSNLPAKPKVLTRPREGHQLTRVPSQGSEENKEVPKEAECKPPMFIRRNKMTIPIADYFSKSNSPSSPKSQESISTKPMSARSIQQRCNLSPQRTFSPSTYQR
uniref:Uncharacterized protein n=1 Tax=Molossus molossus TaxID=27622 RepID=A0A7J8JR04_MOLMO|nr:hypothetical protein HJG59_001881 [Molossus molossus]